MNRAKALVTRFSQSLRLVRLRRDHAVELLGEYAQFPPELRKQLDEIFQTRPTQWSPIAPMPTGTRFSGQIRFNNLTAVELGALLFVLDLPADMAHKIGLGKPLGLGSIRIQPQLRLTSRKSRYQSLFNDDTDGWETASESSTDPNAYVSAFSNYVGKHLLQNPDLSPAELWREPSRILALKHMLTFDHSGIDGDWQKRMRHQLINIAREKDGTGYKRIANPEERDQSEFRERLSLPRPESVLRRDTYKRKAAPKRNTEPNDQNF